MPTNKQSNKQSQSMNLLTSSDSQDWYTPLKYIEAVRETFGGVIDLDPASCAEANETVNATRFYSKEGFDNGLTQLWSGKVFCNPPYGKTNGKSNQGLFSDKLCYEYQAGRVKEAILLVNLYPGYSWFAPLRDKPRCELDHRIAFVSPNDNDDGNNKGKEKEEAKASSVFIYFGIDPTKFYTVFSRFGFCGQLKRYL